jgi:hypothetical protein
MEKLFINYDLEIMENFEHIFDQAANEKTAKQNALNYYISLVDDNEEVDIQEVVNLAESYGYDFDDFESLTETE